MAPTNSIESTLSLHFITSIALLSGQSFKIRQAASEGPVTELHMLYSYLSYLRLRLTNDRNMALIDCYTAVMAGKQQPGRGVKLPREQDVVRLYDISIQNLAEMIQLAGLEEDIELKTENDAKVAFFKAFRLEFVQRFYES